jgi:hypothetical protein
MTPNEASVAPAPWRNALLLTALAALLAAGGIVHGVWSGRWTTSQELDEALARLDRVPTRVGAWQGRPVDLDVSQAKRAGLDGFVHRRFEDPRTGRAVTILVACGRAGPVASHTPEVCYGGAGFAMDGAPTPFAAGTGARFWTARFTRPGEASTHLRLYWSWSDGGPWQAPAQPRLHFAGAQALYKLYVIQELTDLEEQLDDDRCQGFIRELVPELEKALGRGP